MIKLEDKSGDSEWSITCSNIPESRRNQDTFSSLVTGEPTENEMVKAMMEKFYSRGGAIAPAVV